MPAQSYLPSNALGWAVPLDTQEGLDVSAHPPHLSVAAKYSFPKMNRFS